jgi:hypothetical protein
MATPATWNTSLVLDSVLTTSLMNYMRTLFEQVVTNQFLYNRMFRRGRIETMDGGEAIIVPLLYELNDTVKFYSAYQNLDVSPQDGMAPARYEWKQLSGSVSISRLEERQNAGKNKILSLLNSKMEQLQISLSEKLGRIAYADGSEDSNQAFLGLDALVEAGANSTLGGIDSNANIWWRNQQLDVSGVAGGNFDATTGSAEGDTIIGQTWMRQMYNTSTRGNQQPTVGLTYVQTFEEYEASLTANQRFVDTETASHGFQNLRFKNAIVGWDQDYIVGNTGLPTVGEVGRFYFLNENYLKVIFDSGTNWIHTPFIRPHNQDARTAQILIMGNMVVTNRQRHGVIYGIS